MKLEDKIDLNSLSEKEQDMALDELLDHLIDKARDDFYTFVKLLAPEILPEEFIDGRHIKYIAEELQDVVKSVEDPKREPKRLQLFLPPGSMKSKLASNLFPAWCLGRHPYWCFLAVGADFDFAIDNLGRPTKDLVDLDQYKAIFPETTLKKDVQSAGRWDTTKKGRFVARGAGQGLAGRRAHISICDDVMNEHTTATTRKYINNWYQKGLRTRLLPKGAEIIINTRWHLEDLSGHMEKIDGRTKRPWKIVKVPAILDKEGSEYLRQPDDPPEKYTEGSSFWPELWPLKVLEEKKETLPANEWNALYMQSPTAEEGAIIKRHHFKIWEGEKPPPCKYIVLSMDTAFSQKETADYSAYSLWGVFTSFQKDYEGNDIRQDGIILLSAGKGRWDFAGLMDKAQSLFNQFEPDFVIVEQKASGQSLIPELQKRGVPVVPYMPEKDKYFRLQACTPFFQAGRVFIPENRSWAGELVEEVISFPSAPHDDLTDTVSQAILWLRDHFKIDHEGYGYSLAEEEEERMRARNKEHKSYWSSLVG